MRLGRKRRSIMTDCSPVKWDAYFDAEQDVEVRNDAFHLYSKGNSGPVLFAIHGGGYNALTWSLFAEEITKIVECQVVALDLRGHGSTETKDEELALCTLADDVFEVIEALYHEAPQPIILIGHSMGGAVVVEVAPRIQNLKGVCVIDVVEGTALECLSSMQTILKDRPASFRSVKQAILWCFEAGQTVNLDAARVSMPGRIKNKYSGKLAANEDFVFVTPVDSVHSNSNLNDTLQNSIITEEEEDETSFVSSVSSVVNEIPSPYVWRIDLRKTEKFWEDWYKDLSQKFLDLKAPRMLLLANIQGLDTALTIAQMQGKFQVQVLQKCGHAIQEDQPKEVAKVVAGFIVQQGISAKKSDRSLPET